MNKKKIRQGIIPYEADKFEIGFEGNRADGYAHVLNESEKDEDILRPLFDSIAKFMKDEGLNVYPYPEVELNWKKQKGSPILSYTGYYLPQDKKIVLFCHGRHQKDILRSYAHEMIHHMQNLNGDKLTFTAEDTLPNNAPLEKIESEAYLKGNIYFRKWTEQLKQQQKNSKKKISSKNIDFSSFEVQDELNPNFWKDERLDSRIRLKLLDIADDFTDFLNVDWVKPEDITMTGSLANYNWSDYSDIDLHIIIDYKKVDKRAKFVAEYFKSKKDLWNNEHKNLKIYGFPVEVYVQDKNEPHASSGVYSLEKDKWLEKPEKKKNPKKKDLEAAGRNASKWMNKIDTLMSRYYPDKTDSEKESILDDLDDIFDDIKDDRKGAFKRGEDEMNPNNLTFKVLRRNGYLDKIWDKKTEIYDELNSLNESVGNTDTLIIYHKVDWDGFTSAAIALKAFPHADLYPWNYTDKMLPDTSNYSRVVLVDLTICPNGDYSWMEENAHKLIWIDHHENAMNGFKNSKNVDGIRRKGIGACILTWERFFPNVPLPLHVALCGTYDVVRKDGKYADWEDSWLYQLSLDLIPFNPQLRIEKALEFIDEPQEITIERVKAGEPLEVKRAAEEAERFKTAVFSERDGIKICKIIASGRGLALIKTNSDNNTADIFAIRNPKPIKDYPNLYSVSFRVPEKSNVDASAIARQYGGNGHLKAAGCKMTIEDFNNL